MMQGETHNQKDLHVLLIHLVCCTSELFDLAIGLLPGYYFHFQPAMSYPEQTWNRCVILVVLQITCISNTHKRLLQS